MATAATAQSLGVQVGDFFYASWGYDQTNVDYFQVVDISPSGKSVKIRQVCTARAERGVVPVADNFYDQCRFCSQLLDLELVRGAEPPRQVFVHRHGARLVQCSFTSDGKPHEATPLIQTKVLRKGYQDRPTLAWTSYASLSKWDGTPKYDTRAAGGAGH